MTVVNYPEIESAGGFVPALNVAFKNIGSVLRVSNELNGNTFPGSYALIEHDDKFSQIYIASEEKLFLPDYWRQGVCLAHGKIDELELLAKSIEFWLNNDVKTDQLADKFSFISPSKEASIYDDGNEVEYRWKKILNDPERKEIKEFVELAIKNNTLSKLFPYTSLLTLCFSRCTGYPFTYDTPTVTPILETNQFLVRAHDETEIGHGSVSEALKMVLDNLPSNIGPAVKGTSETI